MGTYDLSKITSITGKSGVPRYQFNIIGARNRPLVTFAFCTQEEADAAHAAMQAIVEITIAVENDSRPRPKTSFRWACTG